MTVQELTDLFRKLGAQDPEIWAKSQIEEGIPQLERYLFLRQAWRSIPSEDATAWIDRAIANFEAEPKAPYADIGRVLKACLARGIPNEDLTALARGLQAMTLFNLTYLLGDPGALEPEVEDTAWALVSLDPNGEHVREIPGLHESVLQTDPTGREMRPKNDA